ncbi:MAG TPA: energy-coupling factor transporter transmembrane component T [Solirubrobacteraceae bacterium]|nr:energy-coupling factor transporter transmembrane component T [Solirubrobacteraceae bacterium]
MIYRRRFSPLHATRPAVGIAWCGALGAVALVADHPVVLAGVLAAVVGGGLLAGVGHELGRAARFALPLALLVAVANPLFVRDGLTVIARLGEVPVLGRLDVTLEATAYGGVLALRAVVLVLVGALYTAAVDPDEVLRLVRRAGFRSALTAALATRMVPVLARDGARLADAQRCRPPEAASRVPRAAVARAVATGALDRAVDVAATLEVRGYGSARRGAPGRRPWSRHDLAFAAGAAAILALVVGGALAGAIDFHAYPALRMASGPAVWAVAAAIPVLALLPFADRRGVGA